MAKLRVDKIAAPIVKDEFTGSVHFDGTDWLIISSSSDFAFGTGDFTIELWAYHTNLTGQQTYFGDTSGATAGIYTYKTTDNAISLYDTAQRSVSSNNVIKLNTWHHIAWTRESGVLRAFLDGVKVDEDTYTGDFTITQYYIGSAGVASEQMLGYISNLRVCKGHAVYTGNFTVPTRELPVHTAPPKGVVFPAADNRTVLLACQSSTDATLDSSGRHTITVNGDPTAADANPGLFRKTNITSTITENTGSVFFDGTGDYLSIENSNDFEFGSNDFTVEFWFNCTKSSAAYQILASRDLWTGGGGETPWMIQLTNSDTVVISGTEEPNPGGWSFSNECSVSVQRNVWNHIAFTRNGNTLNLYANGIKSADHTFSASFEASSNDFIIGRYSSGQYFEGYISNLRVCKGHTVYTSQFIPPTRELELHNESVFLGLYDGENIFADKTGRHIIAAYGDRLSSPTPTATDSPIGITTNYPPVTRSVDATAGPTFQGGAGFVSQNWLTLPKGTTTDRNLCGTRGLFAGSNPQPGDTGGNTIEFITVSTTGNTQDFGDRIGKGRRAIAAMSGSTRAVFAGSYGPSSTIADTIDYVNIATTGNAVDFGNCLSDLTEATGISNSTRGIIAGGRTPTVSNVMQYVTIPTLGNAIDFGDLSVAKRNAGSFQSSTRGVVAGGRNPSGTELNVIEYVTIASTGNAVDFGDISSGGGQNNMGGSNSTRGLVAGGNPSTNTITYVTISTLGNSVDFGDNTAATHGMNTMATSPTRACMFGAANPARTLSYVEIATTGNALDFGSFGIDATTAYSSGCSNSHGGIS